MNEQNILENEQNKLGNARIKQSKLWWILAVSLCFTALYPRLVLIQGVVKVPPAAFGNEIQTMTDENLLTVSMDTIEFRFAFLDLNN